jgi:hypothetical protein
LDGQVERERGAERNEHREDRGGWTVFRTRRRGEVAPGRRSSKNAVGRRNVSVP